ncbi:MAG: hypothetical protein KGM42_10330 [Hyphomicrobiales bacterium]|nr:hypothetical protein [Hyphomicrobiales bacterium]
MKSMLLALGLTLAAAAPALADARSACRQDVETLCNGVERGGGRIMRCMSEHRAALSPTCKMALADRMLERRAERQPGAERGGQPSKQRP